MKYTPDTNACIEYLRGRNAKIMSRMQQQNVRDILLCSVVLGELVYGVYRSSNPLAQLAKVQTFSSLYSILDFDSKAAHEFARIRADLEQRGVPIGPYDTMLVTHNVREFSRVPGLLIEDWQV